MKNPATWTLRKILLPGVGATCAMTLFSYVTSRLMNDQFREPQLLAHFFFPAEKLRGQPPTKGWLLHYLIGIGFSGAYQGLWKKHTRLPPTSDGLCYGSVCGLLGVAVWRLVFATHPLPPKVNLKLYLAHLFAAHFVFGITLSHINNRGKNED